MEENYLKLLQYEQKLEKTGKYLSLEEEKKTLKLSKSNFRSF